VKKQIIVNQPEAYVANVNVTKALAYDPMCVDHDPDDPGTWSMLDAQSYDKDVHGHMEFYCPDCFDKEEALVGLNPPKIEFQQVYRAYERNPQTGAVMYGDNGKPLVTGRLYTIPKHFELKNGQDHQCDLENRLARLSELVKSLHGTVDSYHKTYTLDLEFLNKGMPPQIPFGERKGRLVNKYNKASGSARRSPDQPLAVKSTAEISGVLNATEFDKGRRSNVYFKSGPRLVPLDKMYFESSVDMYCALRFRMLREFGNKTDFKGNRLALFRFHPSGNKKDWRNARDGAKVILSKPEIIEDSQGREFHVRTHLRFETQDSFKVFGDAYNRVDSPKKAGFLVFGDQVDIDPSEYKKGLNAIDKRMAKHAEVHLGVSVSSDKQFVQWMPPSPQMRLFDDDLNVTIPMAEDSELVL